MSIRLFSLIAALATLAILTGCQTDSVPRSPDVPAMSHVTHETGTSPDSDSLTGIWSGTFLDSNDKEVMNVEWTVSPTGEFTGMLGPISSSGNAANTGPTPSLPMKGTLDSNGSVKGSISGSGSGNPGVLEGTLLRSGEKLTGTMIMRPDEANAAGIAMKARLERKPL